MEKLLTRLFVLAAAMFILSTSSSAQADLENPIELRIKGVGLGSTQSAVVSRLGEPVRRKLGKAFLSECSGSRETNLTLSYPGLVIELVGDGRGRNFTVATIALTSARWFVAPQLTVGANTNSIVAKFGKPFRTETESGTTRMIYFHTDGGATFILRSNKLVKIEWGLDRC